MRLHTLRLTAFGPFAATAAVDFDALAAGGLFLFHGPTGAGKSSILDGVCFALYGQVPGTRQQSRSLRSDHAAPGVRPEVMLEATVRGRRIRVTRSPAWERPKQRGTGTTTEQARVRVEERNGDGATWTMLSTRLDETGHLLKGLLGLDREQFCQVVLLPQGQFADFLRADADRRRDLLETVFGTRRFAEVESWLVEARKTGARALDEADRSLAQVLAQIEQVSSADDGAGPGSDLSSADQAADWAGELLARATRQLRHEETAQAAAERARESAAVAVTAATRLHHLQARHRSLAERETTLLAQRAQRDQAAAEVEAARLVAPVLPLLAEVQRLHGQRDAVRGVVAAAHRDLAGFLGATGTSGPPQLVAIAGSAAAARAEAGGLRRLADQESEAAALVASVQELERTVVTLQGESSRVAGWLDHAEDRRDELAGLRATARDAAAELPAARRSHTDAVDRLVAARRRDDASTRLAAADDAVRAATDAAQSARAEWLRLRQCRLDGMAAELAAELVEGGACPVCGSGTHPRRAVVTGEAVSRRDEELAERDVVRAESARAAADATRGRLSVELAGLRVAAGGDTVEALVQAEAATGQRLAEIESAAATLGEAEQAVADFDQDREAMVREKVRLGQESEAARRVATERAQRLDQLRTVLDEARRGDASVAHRAHRLERLAEDCDLLARQAGELERLEAAVDAAQQRAEHAASERDLPSPEAAAEAARSESRVVELEELKQRHDAELAAVHELLAEEEVTTAASQPPPDIDALAAALEDADAALEAAIGRRADRRSRVESLRVLTGRLQRVLEERAPLAQRHHLVDALSRLAEGKSADNRLRMSLSGYVLAARLEQVAAAASLRLAAMSGGRYSFVHRDEADGRSRGGLTLRVLDSWTGTERDGATLSGGETFFASLSLALGLADVVTAEAGGSLLETLFVDEGFGSLDEETLDEVMNVLDDLRDGGRVVGLVSHVADLRQRIPVQLTVDKGRQGSAVHQ